MKPDPWIQTSTGIAFDLLEPTPEMVDINDIARALSRLCRYTGHTEQFYSVAQHSVLVSNLVPPEDALVGLLHDAAEAYVGDVAKPLKVLLGSAYSDVEDRVWRVVAERFGLPVALPQSVKDADLRMLQTERLQLLGPEPRPWNLDAEPYPMKLDPMDPWDACMLFRRRYFHLTYGAQP